MVVINVKLELGFPRKKDLNAVFDYLPLFYFTFYFNEDF